MSRQWVIRCAPTQPRIRACLLPETALVGWLLWAFRGPVALQVYFRGNAGGGCVGFARNLQNARDQSAVVILPRAKSPQLPRSLMLPEQTLC
jgi:hypothetical protein